MGTGYKITYNFSAMGRRSGHDLNLIEDGCGLHALALVGAPDKFPYKVMKPPCFAALCLIICSQKVLPQGCCEVSFWKSSPTVIRAIK